MHNHTVFWLFLCAKMKGDDVPAEAVILTILADVQADTLKV